MTSSILGRGPAATVLGAGSVCRISSTKAAGPTKRSTNAQASRPRRTAGTNRPALAQPQDATLRRRRGRLRHARTDKFAVPICGASRVGRELFEYGPGVEPWRHFGATEQGGVPGPWILVQRIEGHEAGADRVEMNVAEEFQQIRTAVDQGGLEPILKKVAAPLMPAVEADGVAGE